MKNLLLRILTSIIFILLIILLLKNCKREEIRLCLEPSTNATEIPQSINSPEVLSILKPLHSTKKQIDNIKKDKRKSDRYRLKSGWLRKLGKRSLEPNLINESKRFQSYIDKNQGKITAEKLSKEAIPLLCQDFNEKGVTCVPDFFKHNRAERDDWARDIIKHYDQLGKKLITK